jgi:hypothetical protein
MARPANREDKCTGHFFEGRFLKCLRSICLVNRRSQQDANGFKGQCRFKLDIHAHKDYILVPGPWCHYTDVLHTLHVIEYPSLVVTLRSLNPLKNHRIASNE